MGFIEQQWILYGILWIHVSILWSWVAGTSAEQSTMVDNSHMHNKAHPSTLRTRIIHSHLYELSRLTVQDKQTELRPSTSLQQLISASMERSETASAPDRFYKPYALYPTLKRPTPSPPKGAVPQSAPLPEAPLALSAWGFTLRKCSFRQLLQKSFQWSGAKDQQYC